MLIESPMKAEDFKSPTWRRYTKFLEMRLGELREQNDRHKDSEQTAATRGSIAEVKRMLALGETLSASEGVIPGELTGDGYEIDSD